jgi:hypothetical protein
MQNLGRSELINPASEIHRSNLKTQTRGTMKKLTVLICMLQNISII